MCDIIRVLNVSKAFGDKIILENVSLSIKAGEFVAISGKSGSGKSTLLNLIGMLEPIDSGEIYLCDEMIPLPFSKKASKLLKNDVGYLFQNYGLIDNKDVYYNLRLVCNKKKTEKKTIKDALSLVGLENFESKKIFQCSGGEQQRVAIARLLIKNCKVILCDEPTGSLDEENSRNIISILKELSSRGHTVVIVTHDSDVLDAADRVINLNLINQSE